MRRQGSPKRFELVVCKIVKIFPHSALAELIEYRKRGLIHVSEVALKWVKNIREFLKINQFVVCQVMRVDGEDISLSVKRVRREESDRRLNEFKRETKAEKALELTAKEMKKTLDDAYREVGYLLQEEFGSIQKAFEFAVKNPDLLKSKGVPKAWLEPIIKTAQKSYTEKEYQVKAKLNIVCYGPQGIKIIKKALSDVEGDGLEVRYVSAPKYQIIGRGKNFKELKARVQGAAERISSELSSNKGTCEFEIKESR
jgi:translation initiation factor 2 subunit 1